MQKHSSVAILCWLAESGLSPDLLRILLDECPVPELILEKFLCTGSLPIECPLPSGIQTHLRSSCSDSELSRWEQAAERHGIQAVTVAEESFPDHLRNLPEAPAILFFLGQLKALEYASVSMVGSRNASYKGLEATEKTAEKLSRSGISVVSGLAYGIDAAAHRGCLKGGTPTIAVMGCGLDQDYPAENAGLKKEILRNGGLILSEYAPGEKPLGWHFPYRNRIISGLGDCLILMEARIRSGSMTTVQHALNQGKDVFVYPGEPGSAKSEGNHQLLREGAIYFTSAEDIMEDMGWLDKRMDVRQNNESVTEPLVPLSPDEKTVLEQLDKGERSFDQLCDALMMPASQLNATLSLLQIHGMIRVLPGRVFQKKLE